MAGMKEVMRYALDLDVKGFQQGLDKAEKGAKDTFDDIEDAGEDSAKRFEGLGGKMGAGLVAGFGALGVGALLMQGINQAMDAEQGVKRLEGQFRITAQDAEKYGKMAGDLYAGNWGDSLREVQQNVATAAQRLGDITDDELASVSEGILAVADTWQVDFNDVLRSTTQLLENDLAPSAEDALDLITTAFQRGGDEAGDLLDTIDEYSQHWAAWGLSGEEALNQLISGLQNGQRDTDKMADAVKEMFIRTTDGSDATRQAFQDLGFNADAMQEKILAGGESARGAFIEIIDALIRSKARGDDNTDAIALLGTQYEDLGPKALESLRTIEGALGDTKDATDDLVDNIDESTTSWDKWKRRGTVALTEVGGGLLDGLDAAESYFGFFSKAGEEFGETLLGKSSATNRQLVEDFNNSEQAYKDFDTSVLNGLDTWDDVHAKVLEVTDSYHTANLVTIDWKESEDKLTASIDAAADSTDRGASKGAHYRDTVQGVADATGDAADETADLAEEVDTLNESFERLRGEISEKRGLRSLTDLFDDVQDAAEKAFTTASEGSEDAAEAADDYDRKLDDLRLKVMDYGEGVGQLPDEKITEVLAMIDRGDLEAVKAELDELERERTTRVNIVSHYRSVGSADAPTVRPVNGPRARGGPTYPGLHPVIENGPELLQDGGKTYLMSNGGGNVVPLSGAGSGGGMSGSTYNVTVNAGMGASGPDIGRQVVEAIKQFERGAGNGWRS